jgi:hypothetical protein
MERDEELCKWNWNSTVSRIDDQRPPEISELSAVLEQTIRDLEAIRTEGASQCVQDTVQLDSAGSGILGEDEIEVDGVESYSSMDAMAGGCMVSATYLKRSNKCG